MKFKSKPWITLGLQKSISVKNKLLTNFINKKDPILKEEFHTSKQLADLANLPFMTGIFQIALKTAKVVPIFK